MDDPLKVAIEGLKKVMRRYQSETAIPYNDMADTAWDMNVDARDTLIKLESLGIETGWTK